ncbi:Methyltransferase_domain-containing protein [Hexamita inflata]|uniref:Methyltransferase domain-containing protein n=1 Tax=Hexamita inflata TaxID=28002 RepID=A0AA86V1P1_9EUKA|nr:Methyltransferase domain-containing protein [Hexamita inflata]
MEQLKKYITYRDTEIDHQLFGSFDYHRDILIVVKIDDQVFSYDRSQITSNFRKIYEISLSSQLLVNTQEYLLFLENQKFPNAPIYIQQEVQFILPSPVVITPSQIVSQFIQQQKEIVPDSSLANPPIYSGLQASTLLQNRQFLELFADWLMVRSPDIRKYRVPLRQVEDFLYRYRNMKDEEFQLQLYKFLHQRERPAPKQSDPPNSAKRQTQRVNELKEVVSGQQISNILDIGCSDGFIVEQCGQALNLSKESIYGMDIRPCISQNITFIESSGTEFNPDFEHKIDLITISMTLHHISQYKQVLKNAYRYLKPNQFLFIREHDACTNEIKLLLDLHDQSFNSSLWDFPESNHSEFVNN